MKSEKEEQVEDDLQRSDRIIVILHVLRGYCFWLAQSERDPLLVSDGSSKLWKQSALSRSTPAFPRRLGSLGISLLQLARGRSWEEAPAFGHGSRTDLAVFSLTCWDKSDGCLMRIRTWGRLCYFSLFIHRAPLFTAAFLQRSCANGTRQRHSIITATHGISVCLPTSGSSLFFDAGPATSA